MAVSQKDEIVKPEIATGINFLSESRPAATAKSEKSLIDAADSSAHIGLMPVKFIPIEIRVNRAMAPKIFGRQGL